MVKRLKARPIARNVFCSNFVSFANAWAKKGATRMHPISEKTNQYSVLANPYEEFLIKYFANSDTEIEG